MSVRFSLTLAVAAALLLGGCDRETAQPAQQAESETGLDGEIDESFAGTLMPALNVSDPAGRTLNTGALQGTPVLLNLWATWCAPCVTEMPMLDALAGDYDGRLRVVTVSQDMGGADKVEDFFAARDFAHLEPWIDPETELSFAFEGGVLPTSVLYDAQGRELFRVVGGYDWSSPQAREAIAAALSR